MVKILHDLSSGSVSDALRAVSPHPDVNVGEASGSCRIFSTRACRPFGSSGLNIKIQGLRGEKPVSRNRCRIYRSNSSSSSSSSTLSYFIVSPFPCGGWHVLLARSRALRRASISS